MPFYFTLNWGFYSPDFWGCKDTDYTIDLSQTNDLMLGCQKFSGMAQRVYDRKRLVHGTILYDVNLENLGKALSNKLGKFSSPKGVKSRHATVVNLKPYLEGINDISMLKSYLNNYFKSVYQATPLNISSTVSSIAKDLAQSRFKPLYQNR